jgi:ABC-type dipeptide/oligopeptide/nickel transport system ATPase component
VLEGTVLLDGDELLTKSEKEMQRIRGRKVAMILQDPMSSLNPVFSIGMQLREPVAAYHGLRGAALRRRAAELLASVRIPSPEARLRAFPHQLSGGMRQRVVGAMAIAAPPRLLIADEPTTSLDLTIQAQYLGLLKELQERHHFAMIFVTHNLGIVAKMCERVAVMYAGRIVEMGPVREIFTSPRHRTRRPCSNPSRASAPSSTASRPSRASRPTSPGSPPAAPSPPAVPGSWIAATRRPPSWQWRPGTAAAAGCRRRRDGRPWPILSCPRRSPALRRTTAACSRSPT